MLNQPNKTKNSGRTHRPCASSLRGDGTVHGGRWRELSTRDEAKGAHLMDVSLQIATGRTKKAVDVSRIGGHLVQETASLERRKFIINMKVLSPVFREGAMVAIIAVNRTEAVI